MLHRRRTLGNPLSGVWVRAGNRQACGTSMAMDWEEMGASGREAEVDAEEEGGR